MGRHLTSASTEWIDLHPGGSAALDGGPMSVAVIWRPTTVHIGSLLYASNAGGFEVHSFMPIDDGHLWHQIGGSFRQAQAYTAVDGWRIDGWSKAGGAGQTVRVHHALYSGGGWTHTDVGVCDDAGTAPAATVRVGQKVGVGALDGDVAVIGICGATWTDGQFETLMTSLADWVALIGADPAVLWAFDQADVSTPVVDVLGGGGDQTAINGTTVTTDPPGFSYDLAGIQAVLAATIPAVTVTATATASTVATLSATVQAATVTMSAVAVAPGAPPVMSGTATALTLSGTAQIA